MMGCCWVILKLPILPIYPIPVNPINPPSLIILNPDYLLTDTKTAENPIEYRFRHVFAEDFAEGLHSDAQVNRPEVEGELLGNRGLDLVQGRLGTG
jgi:hypothetical protein